MQYRREVYVLLNTKYWILFQGMPKGNSEFGVREIEALRRNEANAKRHVKNECKNNNTPSKLINPNVTAFIT